MKKSSNPKVKKLAFIWLMLIPLLFFILLGFSQFFFDYGWAPPAVIASLLGLWKSALLWNETTPTNGSSTSAPVFGNIPAVPQQNPQQTSSELNKVFSEIKAKPTTVVEHLPQQKPLEEILKEMKEKGRPPDNP